MAKPHSSVSSIEDLRRGGRLFEPPAWPIFFLRINDSLDFSLTVCCFDDGYVGKQPVAWKEYCV